MRTDYLPITSAERNSYSYFVC